MALWKKSESAPAEIIESKEPAPAPEAPVQVKTNIPKKTIMANNINEVNRIAEGTKFVGDFATASDLRIDGTFEGRLYCATRVIVGEKAVIKGDVFCSILDFNGTMSSGNLYVKDTLSLKAGCSVEGDLFFKRLQVELDAKYTGKCQMIAESEFDKVASEVASMLPKQ